MCDTLSADRLRHDLRHTRVLREYRVFSEIGSTNTYLKEEARGDAEGLVVVAEYQSAGRGRQGRTWIAPPGSSLHVSVLLRPELPLGDLYLLTAACGLAVRDAVAPLVTDAVVLKWPNDVLLGGRKVCGILAETELSAGCPPRVVLGCGINVHRAPDPAIVPDATCVAAHAKGGANRHGILTAVLRHFDTLLASLYAGERDAVWHEWRQGLETLGQRVRVRSAEGTIEGLAIDVARDGGIILQTGPGGATRTLYAAEAIEQVDPV